jgi:hypothetical protein
MINQADDLTSGAIGVISHPLTVQVINQGSGIWGNVATGLITAGAAIAAVMLTHRFTLHREKLASEKKLVQERLFISTELVFMLEQFAESCASVATDWGYENQDGISVPQTPTPVIDYSTIAGDWRALPGRLMYQVRGLTVLKSTSDRIIDDAEYYAPDFEEFFSERQYQYTRLGLKAVILARRLRRLVGFPETPLNASPWSAQHVLWHEWRKERHRRAEQAVMRTRSLATFQALKAAEDKTEVPQKGDIS